MNETAILVSDPSAMEWLVGLALPVVVGLVGGLVLWRIVRAYKNLSSRKDRKGPSSDDKS